MYLSGAESGIPNNLDVGTPHDKKSSRQGEPHPVRELNINPKPAAGAVEEPPPDWQPPKEVIWMGHRQRVLALSAILTAGITAAEAAKCHLDT
jgi:hypothetical protein